MGVISKIKSAGIRGLSNRWSGTSKSFAGNRKSKQLISFIHI